ncbi:MAG: hypothetical protein H6719_34695 [Sandaracinaceae bacterium]|nr:hypothetical protein [Sandaracinaceae bacterium]
MSVSRQSEVLVGLVALIVATTSTVAMADPPPALREVETALVQADREGVRLLRLLDETRLARNAPRIACVDSQLFQLNSVARLLELRRDRIRSAVARGDQAEIAHERQVVRRLVAELTRVSRAGRACVYPPAGAANQTIVEVTISREIQHEELDPPPLRP